MSSAGSSTSKVQTVAYEFTKRKRWTDTLFAETSEAIFLIISPSFKILYCNPAVVDILGWKEDQLIDADLRSFVEQEDLQDFVWAFTEVLRLGNGLFTYARFKFEHHPSMTSVPNLLFEIKGRVHYFSGQPHVRCVFLSAMPYPSRDITFLNSFLGLKIENERLSRRICEMKRLIEASTHSQDGSASVSQSEGTSKDASFSFASKSTSTPYASFICSESSGSELSHCGADFPLSSSSLEDLSFGPDTDYDEVQRKKKKTLFGEEQRVCMTCGRTDSPEWRKGPHGPKTLCNACGLRWAKRARKDEPEITTILKDTSVLPSETSSASELGTNTHMTF